MNKKITAWWDDMKREEILKTPSEVYYYMIYSDTAVERQKWAQAFLKPFEAMIHNIFDEPSDY